MNSKRNYFMSVRSIAFIVCILFGILSLAGCGGSSTATFTPTPAPPKENVTTEYGTVQGYAPQAGTLAWKGIPYAKPPVGDLRWKAPVDPDPWTGTRDATTSCSACVQQVYNQYWMSSNAFTGSEDCLYLDIYAPDTTAANLPVYVFIHGGSNNFGTIATYDGANLAKRGNIIVVFIQYRLAAMGFLTHPALRQSGTAEDKSGNYGALDQIKALTWIKNNIAAFGGDPAKIVIGGQSAGAHNVMNLVVSPLAQGLFRGVFVQSPAMDLFDVATADAKTNQTIDGLLIRDGLAADAAAAAAYRAGMSNAQIETYLRGKSAELIMRARRDGTGADGSGLMIAHAAIRDGSVVRDATWTEAIAAGTYNKVPVVVGNTKDESKDQYPLYGAYIKAYTGGTVPSGTKTWLDLFKVIGVGGSLALTDVLPTQTDMDFYGALGSLGSRKWKATYTDTVAREFKTNDASNPVYAFLFNWDGGGDPAMADFKFVFGAGHAMDVPFFFGWNRDLFNYSFTAANQAGLVALQEAMMDYLIGFVKNLDPNANGSSLPAWPQWSNTAGEDKLITFNADLNNYLIGTDITEETMAAVSADIAAAKALYPAWGIVFTILGL